jgi:RHS repeat-associated protein
VQEIVWAGDMPIAVFQGSTVYGIHTDHLNTPRRIGSANKTQWQWGYDAFGQIVPTGSLSFNLRYPGQYYDAETGLHQNGYRDYDPSTGRYLESDPTGLTGGTNPYAYVGGNPVGAIDPDGLRDVDVYVWRAEGSSVGHVMVTEPNSTQVILSQFPSNGYPWGQNQTKTFADTMAAEDRSPTEIWRVNVPDDKAFDQAAARERNLKLWSWSPSEGSTQCSIAASRALQAGGVGITTVTTGTLFPGFFANNLRLHGGVNIARP